MCVCVCVCVHRNACERKITECQFADDAALPSSSRSGAEKAVMEYQQTNRFWVDF